MTTSPYSKAIGLPVYLCVHAGQHPPHFRDRTDRDQLDSILIGEGLHLLAWRQLQLFSYRLGITIWYLGEMITVVISPPPSILRMSYVNSIDPIIVYQLVYSESKYESHAGARAIL